MTSLNLTDDQFRRVQKVITQAAKSVSAQWPGVIEAEDVEQTIYLKLLESPGTVAKLPGLEGQGTAPVPHPDGPSDRQSGAN
ncbi:sigma-K factor [Mycobacterium phage BTCU-1]|uniref:Uncharacterized protein n=1 Tax=Mycobacterium phage BTCU-1 TaxID=1262532 RepID=R9R4A2_9CAUD|nr:sigma-K factor [Mycobacterium phage BTCU-1]AGI61734.1 hypothetical protein CKC_53 [Mycobacterium phage BTCU-1]